MRFLKQILAESSAFLLLEYDQEKTIKNHGDKALKVALERQGEHGDSYLRDVHGVYHGHVVSSYGSGADAAKKELFSQFEESDPTPNKKYVQHIARIYGNGGVNRHEDIYSRMKPALRTFDDLAKRKVIPPEHRDIGKYKSLSDLEDVIDAHKESKSGKEQSAAYHELMKSQATITEHPDFTHIIPHTVESAAHFGKGTRWCTATEDPKNSMFNHYNSHGPLQIYVPKQQLPAGEKYQYHYSSGQLMDPRDMPMEDDKTGHYGIDNHIDHYKKSAEQAHLTTDGFYHPELKVKNKTLAKHWDNATQEHIDNIVRGGGVLNHYEQDYHRDQAGYDGYEFRSVNDHPLFNRDHIHHILDNYSDTQTKVDMMHHPAVDQSHVDKALKQVLSKNSDDLEPEDHELYDAAMQVTSDPKHLKQMHDDITHEGGTTNNSVYAYARNKNVSGDMLHDTLINTKNANIKERLMGHIVHSRIPLSGGGAETNDETLEHIRSKSTVADYKESALKILQKRFKDSEAKKAKSLKSIVNFNPTTNS